jgi:hypothetical protein
VLLYKKNEECDCGHETCSKQCVTGIMCTREHKADYSDVSQTPPIPPEQMWEQEYHTVRLIHDNLSVQRY